MDTRCTEKKELDERITPKKEKREENIKAPIDDVSNQFINASGLESLQQRGAPSFEILNQPEWKC